MKYRFKLSASQKFALEFEPSASYGNVKSAVRAFISSTYEENIDSILLSLNGKEPLEGSDDDTFSTLGVRAGDLLCILRSFTQVESHSTLNYSKPSVSKGDSSANSISKLAAAAAENRKVTVNEPHEKAPSYLVDAFCQYEPSSPAEVMNLLIHLLMKENGFNLAANCCSLPPSWRDMVCNLQYNNPSYGDFCCTLVIVTMGDTKQILVSFPGQTSEISLKANISDYVHQTEAFTIEVVKNLDQFSFNFKSNLLYPLQISAHNTLGIPAPWHLAGLPQEILIKILRFLNLGNLLNLGLTCKRLHSSTIDPKVWFSLFKRDFPDYAHESDALTGADWKAKYKSAYSNKKKNVSYDDKTFVVPLPQQPLPRPFPYPNHPNRDPFNPLRPQPHNPFPYNIPEPDPFNPFRDPDGQFFQDPPPHMPGGPMPPNPMMGPSRRRPRGPQIKFI